MDDSEKDELKSTLYDNNGNNNTTEVIESVISSSSARDNKNNRIVTPGLNHGRGGFESTQKVLIRNQQQGTYKPSSSSSSSLGNCQSSYSSSKVSRPKPTTWVTNRKFQLQSTNTSQPSISKTNTTVGSKRYAYQHQQQQNNNNSGVSSDNFSIEYNQHQQQGSKNRYNNTKRNYDVNLNSNSGTNNSNNNSAKTVLNKNPHCRRNSENSGYSTDSTSVDYICDETSYGKQVTFLKSVFICFILLVLVNKIFIISVDMFAKQFFVVEEMTFVRMVMS